MGIGGVATDPPVGGEGDDDDDRGGRVEFPGGLGLRGSPKQGRTELVFEVPTGSKLESISFRPPPTEPPKSKEPVRLPLGWDYIRS